MALDFTNTTGALFQPPRQAWSCNRQSTLAPSDTIDSHDQYQHWGRGTIQQ